MVSYQAFVPGCVMLFFFLQVFQTKSLFLKMALVRQFIALFFSCSIIVFLLVETLSFSRFLSFIFVVSECVPGGKPHYWPNTLSSPSYYYKPIALFLHANKLQLYSYFTRFCLFYVAVAFETNASNVIKVTVFFPCRQVSNFSAPPVLFHDTKVLAGQRTRQITMVLAYKSSHDCDCRAWWLA